MAEPMEEDNPPKPAGGMESDFAYVAQLIDQLRHEDASKRLESTRNLEVVANALGPSRVRGELVPFLKESTDDDDEILLVMAEKLGGLVEAVGGADFAYHLLGPLEALAAVDESSVRDKAVESIQQVVVTMPPNHLSEHYLEMLTRMSQREWFTARISACSLFVQAYPRVNHCEKGRMLDLFTALAKDATPMVRRAASAALGPFAGEVEAERTAAVLLPLFEALAQDDQDSVRQGTMENAVHLARALEGGAAAAAAAPAAAVLRVALAAAGDRSWRVRWAAAGKLDELAAALGPPAANGELVLAYEKLLQDGEPEVRTSAAFAVAKVAAQLQPAALLEHVLPCLQQLVLDGSEHVRGALATVVNDVAPALGREHTVNHLLPLLLTLLRDETSEVRLNIIAKLDAIHQVIGVDLLSQSLLPAIVDLAEDGKWRVRLAIIDHVPRLAEQLGPGFFDAQLCELCLGWLGDDVHAVRLAAAANLRALAAAFGTEWALGRVVPRVAELKGRPAFAPRMTALYAAGVLAEALEPAALRRAVLPFVLELARDPVPNVRFAAARALEGIGARLAGAAAAAAGGEGGGGAGAGAVAEGAGIAGALRELMGDKDRDVRYFSRRAAQAMAVAVAN